MVEIPHLFISHFPDQAFNDGLHTFRTSSHVEVQDTRNGLAKVYLGAWITQHRCPTDRILWHKQRRANPFFHLAEAVWMLAGRDDVKFISQFNKNMASYSDDGETFNAAYGHRWSIHFGFDQVAAAIKKLRASPTTRRVCISMWDPAFDLDYNGKDVPCNVLCSFNARKGVLDMTVFNRSNDMVWGAYGANLVHFSFLLEVVAHFTGLKVGTMQQITTNMHLYKHHWDLKQENEPIQKAVATRTYLSDYRSWQEFTDDCERVCEGDDPEGQWLKGIVVPMLRAWETRDSSFLSSNYDWHAAGAQWLNKS